MDITLSADCGLLELELEERLNLAHSNFGHQHQQAVPLPGKFCRTPALLRAAPTPFGAAAYRSM
jgi:hypothetical protein